MATDDRLASEDYMPRRNPLAVALAVFVFFAICPIFGVDQASPEGKLVVLALLGDDNAPSKDAFVYVRGYLGQPSIAVSPSRVGWFEISLHPGLYDVFVSEGSSLPMCRRFEVKANETKVYHAKLEPDDDHLEN